MPKKRKFVNPYRDTPAKNAQVEVVLHRIRVKEWIKQSGYQIDTKEMTQHFNSIAETTHRRAVKAAISNLALIEGLQRANDTLQVSMNMERVGYNIQDGIRLADSFLRIVVARSLLSKVNLTRKTKRAIFDRLIARSFPLQDNRSNANRSRQEAAQTRERRGSPRAKSPPVRVKQQQQNLTPQGLSPGDPPYF